MESEVLGLAKKSGSVSEEKKKKKRIGKGFGKLLLYLLWMKEYLMLSFIPLFPCFGGTSPHFRFSSTILFFISS